MKKVIVGLSGGVDSAVTAYLLKQKGYEVIGLTLKTWESEDGVQSRCCEIDDARETAERLGIPFYTHNCVSRFRERVTEPFVHCYLSGLTPNPCIECNRYVKWEYLLHYAELLKADHVATGHYALMEKLDNGRYTVRRILNDKKDQTYMLYKLSQEALSKTLLPLGTYSKDEVRRIAEEAGLNVAGKKDSQEICFVPDNDYAGFIERSCRGRDKAAGSPGEGGDRKYAETALNKGFFVNEEGDILGEHKGIIHYTVGQRKGLGLPLGYPAYVKRIDPENNEVVIGDEGSVMSTGLFCRDLNFLSIPGLRDGEELRCLVKIRYHHQGEWAVIKMDRESSLKVTFEAPVKSAAPGQSAVFYDFEGRVIGGGVICPPSANG